MWKTFSLQLLLLASSNIFVLPKSTTNQDFFPEGFLQLPPCNPSYSNNESSSEMQPQPFVVGGNKSYPTEFPWIVNIRAKTELEFCGGSIIDWNVILTAAHCVVKKGTEELLAVKDVAVIAGDFDITCFDKTEQVSSAREIHIHQNFNWKSSANDIALIILATKFKQTEAVKRIKLPLHDITENSKTAIVAGWGTTKTSQFSNILLTAEVPIVRNIGTCNINNNKLQLCAGGNGTDACTGDSGGPLLCNHNQIRFVCGIISYGQDPVCGDLPGVYTNVYGYLAWIQENRNLKESNIILILLGIFGFLAIAVMLTVGICHHLFEGNFNNYTLFSRNNL